MLNSEIKMFAEFILQKRSPYKILVTNLHNFVSGTTIPSTFTKKTLNFYYTEKSNMKFFELNIFQTGLKISDTVHQIAFPKPVKSSKKIFLTSNIPSNKLNVKKCKEGHKLNGIARSIGIALSQFLQFDLLTNYSLFGEQPPSKLDKHKIVTKLEQVLEIKNDVKTLDDTNFWLLALSLCCVIYQRNISKFFRSFLLQDGNILKMLPNLINSILCSTAILQTP